MRHSRFFQSSWLVLGVVSLALPLCGQCTPAVVGEGTFPEADNTVFALCSWDPDLSGPAPEVVVVGGAFRSFGNVAAAGLATYDPATRTCAPLLGSLQMTGPGVASIRGVVVAPNNDLVVAGQFSALDGVAAANVARWNGVAWQPMGAGVPFGGALLVMPNGDLLVGGAGVQRWDGASWSPLGSLGGGVAALVRLPNGDVVAGGTSLLPGNVHLARWDGTSWSSFSASPDAGVLDLEVAQNGDLLVAGGFLNVGALAAAGVARFDGVAWQGIGGGIFNPVHCIEELANGDLLVGGLFAAVGGVPGFGGTPANQIARWNGTQWSAIGEGLPAGGPTPPSTQPLPVRVVLPLAGGELLAGGDFLPVAGTAGRNRIARWNGANWSSVRPGTGGAVLSTIETASGLGYAVGSFTSLEGVAANRVAVRVQGVWQPLGSGANDTVNAVVVLPNGDVVIGGTFSTAGGVPCNRVALWNGASWSALGAGLPATVRSLAVDAQGKLLARGDFFDQVAVWDGQAWNGTGVAWAVPIVTGGVLRTSRSGDLMTAYYAPSAGGTIARWNGTSWIPLAVAAWATDFGELANGDLVVASNSLVRRWNGSAWTNYPLLSGSVRSLAVLPNDDLLVAVQIASNPPTSSLQRWNGSAWTVLGESVGGTIAELRWRSDGSLSVCGGFRQLLGTETAAFARLATNCPASTVLAGAGCSGSGGANSLVATSLPWAGSTFTSRAAGLLPGSLALEVLGLSALSTPLAALLPQGGVGCSLLASPDVLRAYVVPAAQLDLGLAIPDSTAWIGASLRQQVVPVEIDALGMVQALTATPALELTIGRF